MHVTILLNHSVDSARAYREDGYRPGHELRPVLSCTLSDLNPNRPLKGEAGILDYLFELLNVGDDPAFRTPHPVAVRYRADRNRSLSVSDVVQLDDTFYACEPTGWKPIPDRPTII